LRCLCGLERSRAFVSLLILFLPRFSPPAHTQFTTLLFPSKAPSSASQFFQLWRLECPFRRMRNCSSLHETLTLPFTFPVLQRRLMLIHAATLLESRCGPFPFQEVAFSPDRVTPPLWFPALAKSPLHDVPSYHPRHQLFSPTPICRPSPPYPLLLRDLDRSAKILTTTVDVSVTLFLLHHAFCLLSGPSPHQGPPHCIFEVDNFISLSSIMPGHIVLLNRIPRNGRFFSFFPGSNKIFSAAWIVACARVYLRTSNSCCQFSDPPPPVPEFDLFFLRIVFYN